MTVNTLNDREYNDINVTGALKSENPTPPPVGDEYDTILSTFKKIMKDQTAASKFTDSLYEVAHTTGIDVLVLFNSLNITNEMSLTASLAYYLNSLNSSSTLYGIQNQITPNYYAGRNVKG